MKYFPVRKGGSEDVSGYYDVFRKKVVFQNLQFMLPLMPQRAEKLKTWKMKEFTTCVSQNYWLQPLITEEHSVLCQTYKMKSFAKIVNG